ncbi:MAG: terminase large subunit [Candidatus Rokubacteria bacterium]|nr:terminase large subunit [Candidatus Rokubacteria bacterium]
MTRPPSTRRLIVAASAQSNTVEVHLLEKKMTRAELDALLTNETGQPLVRLPWYVEADAAMDDPAAKLVALSARRQEGKTTYQTRTAMGELMLKPASYTLMVAASEGQQQAIFLRKLRRPFEALLTRLGVKRNAAIITKKSIELLELGSKVEVVATSEVTSPGRSVSLLIFDEARDISDAVFTSLAPSVLAMPGSKILVASTAGPPRGWFYELIRNPLPETRVVTSTGNCNPFADQGMLSFLERQLARISPAAARRELQNEFVEDSESFLPEALIEAAIDDDLVVLA